MSMASVRCPSAGRDLLLVSFKEAKLSVLQYDPQVNNLITLSMHYFEEDDMKVGFFLILFLLTPVMLRCEFRPCDYLTKATEIQSL